MRKSSDPTYSQLADITISLDNDWDYVKTDALIENKVIRDGTHAYGAVNEDILNYYSHLEDKHKTHWYRGTGTILSEYPYTNWLSKKKWPLNEELNLHIMRYQEVTLHNLYLILTFYSHYIPRRDWSTKSSHTSSGNGLKMTWRMSSSLSQTGCH